MTNNSSAFDGLVGLQCPSNGLVCTTSGNNFSKVLLLVILFYVNIIKTNSYLTIPTIFRITFSTQHPRWYCHMFPLSSSCSCGSGGSRRPTEGTRGFSVPEGRLPAHTLG